jgi:pimeloyl-ACP methyl ester carboxylesterase
VFAAVAATTAWGPADGATIETAKLVTESTLIPSTDAGIQLYLREKRPADLVQFSSDRILLYVHGASYPAETMFDLPLDGVSMMEWIAQRGWDVWLVDVRGYGGSTRPPEMNRPAQENQPIVDTATAAQRCGISYRTYSAKARRAEDQLDGLVLGHRDHGQLYSRAQRSGCPASALCACMDL